MWNDRGEGLPFVFHTFGFQPEKKDLDLPLTDLLRLFIFDTGGGSL